MITLKKLLLILSFFGNFAGLVAAHQQVSRRAQHPRSFCFDRYSSAQKARFQELVAQGAILVEEHYISNTLYVEVKFLDGRYFLIYKNGSVEELRPEESSEDEEEVMQEEDQGQSADPSAFDLDEVIADYENRDEGADVEYEDRDEHTDDFVERAV